MFPRPSRSTLFPYTTLFRSVSGEAGYYSFGTTNFVPGVFVGPVAGTGVKLPNYTFWNAGLRSEEHTSELQSRPHLVCRLLLEKKKSFGANTMARITPKLDDL